MNFQHEGTEAVMLKVASGVQNGGAILAAGSGSATVLGLTTSQWSVVGIIGGLVIAVIGLVAKAVIDVYFQHERLKLARARTAEADSV